VHWQSTIINEFKAAGRWLLPAVCPLCDKRRDAQQPLCCDCLHELQPLPECRCPVCALPYLNEGGTQHLCGDCTTSPPPFDGVCALGLYNGLLKTAIGQLKYRQLPLLDGPLGQLLAATINDNWPEARFELIIPVPLHPTRLRERSFNQSLLLARELGRRLRLPVAANQVRRVRHTPPQQGLKAAARQKNLQTALQVDADMSNKSILLVDDVMTTGATARACCSLLRKAGAEEVRVAVLARAPRYLLKV